jgi:hypothetical protein
MLSLTAVGVAASACMVLAALRGPRWALVGVVVGAGGYVTVRRLGLP